MEVRGNRATFVRINSNRIRKGQGGPERGVFSVFSGLDTSGSQKDSMDRRRAELRKTRRSSIVIERKGELRAASEQRGKVSAAS